MIAQGTFGHIECGMERLGAARAQALASGTRCP